MTTRVETTHDIRDAHSDIGGRDVETIRSVLVNNPDATVAWLKDWIAEEKDLEYVESSDQVAVVRIDRETDKAWGVLQAGGYDVVWLPKSQSRVFMLAAGVEDIDSDQQTLGEL